MTNTITLKDIYDICDRLEQKMDRRMCTVEKKIDVLESFRDNLLGKIAVITIFISAVFTLSIAWVKDKLGF
jgi:hypothetical protein